MWKPQVYQTVNSDPMSCCRLFVLDKGQSLTKDTQCQKTTVKVDDPNPVWAEEFRLPVFQPDQELTLQMWDWDLGSPDDEIGQGSLLIQELLSGTTRDVAVEIKPAHVGQLNSHHCNQLTLWSATLPRSCLVSVIYRQSKTRQSSHRVLQHVCSSALHAMLAATLQFRQS